MIHEPKKIKNELLDILADASKHPKETIRDAIALIRQMEGDLRRQGFNEYNEKEETL